VLVVCSETTAQVMAECRLAERAATNAAERDRLWRNSRDLLVVTGTDGRLRSVSPAWTLVLGWTADEVVGRSHLDFIHPDDHEASRAALGHAASPEGLPAYENRLRHKDGSYHRISWVAVLEDDLIYVTGRHVTAEKAASEALERSEARLRSLFETSYQLQGLVALDGTLLDVNATALTAIGVEYGTVVGRPFWDMAWFAATPGIPEQVRQAVSAAAAGHSARQEVSVRLPSGTRVFDFSMRPMRDRHGAVIAVVSEAIDITERRLTEEALRQSQKMEAVGQLTGGIAHDFNNMLQGIASGIELARRRIDRGKPAEASRFLDAAQEAVDRAAMLTRRLLAFGRRQALDPRPVLLNDLIGGIDDLVRQTVGPLIQVETQFQDGCWPVRCDANQLENALLNLAINARDAMLPSAGRLLIRTMNTALDKAATAGWDGASPGDYVRLTVADTGTGMTPEVLAHAFEPFFTTKPDGQGTGLGLSQIYGFVRQSDGLARIDSKPGAGTAIHLYLPRIRDVADRAGPIAPAAAHPPPVAVVAATVVLVANEPTLRSLMVEALRDMGLRVLEGRDGAEGLAALHMALNDGRVDLLVTDIGLPGGMNGRQLAETARRLTPGLPVLLITGHGGDAAGLMARNGHDMEVLGKPFDLEQLAERVRTLLSQARPG